jgi:hypothetical protein
MTAEGSGATELKLWQGAITAPPAIAKIKIEILAYAIEITISYPGEEL